MAVPQRIPVRFEDVFPHGAYVIGVDPVNDFDKVKAGAPDPQERNKDTGERLWSVRVMDADPAARSAEIKVKIPAPAQPVPPDTVANTPFRPVEFDGLTVTAYVDTNRARPRQGYSLRAASMRAVATGRRTSSATTAGAGAAA